MGRTCVCGGGHNTRDSLWIAAARLSTKQASRQAHRPEFVKVQVLIIVLVDLPRQATRTQTTRVCGSGMLAVRRAKRRVGLT